MTNPFASAADPDLYYEVRAGAHPDEWLVVHQSSGRVLARFPGCLEATAHAEQLTEQAHRESEEMLR